MYYIFNVLKCFLAIYMLETQAIAYHKTTNTKYKIDEFIDKLLASKKFDVLAEKIAQKAVERMVNLRPDLRLSKDFVAEIDTPPKIPRNNVSYKTDVHLEDPPSLKNLSLKFKYFTKGVIDDSHEDKDTREENEVTTKKIDPKTNIESDSNEDLSINVSDLESSMQDKPENKSEIKKTSKHNIQVLVNDKNSRKNVTIKADKPEGSLSAENERNAELFENEVTENRENHKTNKTHDPNGVASDFDNNVMNDRALFSNESKEFESKAHKKPRRKRIHREGKRLYTFQSSSDYEEYHQELERVEKHKKVFV